MQKITLKKRKKLYALLALIAIVSMVIPIIGHADPRPILAVEPSAIMKSPEQTFEVNITITNVVDLAIFEFNMTFNPDVLNVTDIDMGPFFEYYYVWYNQSWWYDPNEHAAPLPPGTIWFCASLPMGTPKGGGKSGNGTLVIITFYVKPGATGTSPLDLWTAYPWMLGNSYAQEIEHDVEDGQFSIDIPIADFEYSPSEPHVGELITFNASKSFKEGGTIDGYRWDFGEGTIKVYTKDGGNLTGITTHSYPEEKTYRVKLTVTDNFGLTGSKEEDIGVLAPVEPKHDVAIASVTFEPNIVDAGGEVKITVQAKNNGTFTETFDVKAYYDGTQISPTKPITNLGPGTTQQHTFTWNTAGVPEGLYEIKAEASAVEGESDADKANNVRSGGTVRVRAATGLQNIYLYAGAVIGIGAVAAAAVYLLKIRKPKTT